MVGCRISQNGPGACGLTVGLSLAAFRYAYSLLGWRFLRRTPGGFDWSGLFGVP
jgi:hypothetical protein